MPPARFAAIAALAIFATSLGCGSSGVGVDQCRRVEDARCRAAAGCDLGLDSASNVNECLRFSEDNCLHGLPSRTPPKLSDVSQCVAAIQAAGSCVASHPFAKDCSALDMPQAGSTTVCDVIQSPEEAPACAFLVPGTTTNGTGGSTADAATD